jgi:hypothetical protein
VEPTRVLQMNEENKRKKDELLALNSSKKRSARDVKGTNSEDEGACLNKKCYYGIVDWIYVLIQYATSARTNVHWIISSALLAIYHWIISRALLAISAFLFE